MDMSFTHLWSTMGGLAKAVVPLSIEGAKPTAMQYMGTT